MMSSRFSAKQSRASRPIPTKSAPWPRSRKPAAEAHKFLLRGLQVGEPAGLLRRLAALVYDAVLLAGLLFTSTLIVLPFRGGEAFRPHDPGFMAYLLSVSFVFFGWCWTHGGQTLGMRAWRIQLLAADGGPVSWKQAVARYAFAFVSAACFGLGYLSIELTSRKQAWHDLVSGTQVVRLSPR